MKEANRVPTTLYTLPHANLTGTSRFRRFARDRDPLSAPAWRPPLDVCVVPFLHVGRLPPERGNGPFSARRPLLLASAARAIIRNSLFRLIRQLLHTT